MKRISIKKSSGELAVYSEKKLKRSLMNAGASESQAMDVLQEMRGRLHEGMSTKEIYRVAFKLLKDSSRHLAAKYHLKYAIMELGPSGFPFEKYMAEVLRYQGYRVQTGQIITGKCVNHEIDIIATRNSKKLMIECKYHSQPGIFCDVKIPLYIHSRFNDVMEANEEKEFSATGWIMTNTRFSADAMTYASCAGLQLMGWDYPAGNGLKDQVDALGLYPITCLTSLTRAEKQYLLDRKKVLCYELQENPNLLHQAGLKPGRIDTAMQEVHMLCRHMNKVNVAKFNPGLPVSV